MSSTMDDPEVAPALPETELRHPASSGLDSMATEDLLRLLNAEERVAVAAAGAAVPALARLVDDTVERVQRGGSVHYFGAGTSGRLGVLDAAELIPTFGVPPTLVHAHIAGGESAVRHAVENSEDSEAEGRAEARETVGQDDVVIGLTVSGTTPYVRGALSAARDAGALTALFTSHPVSPLAVLSDHVVVAETGREVLTGSTRLKAGTATKILLNGFSTALMVRLGRTYSNLMVAVVASNRKLRERTLRILSEATGLDAATGSALLDRSEGDLTTAVVAAVGGVEPEVARAALDASGGSVTAALRRVAQEPA